MVLSQLFEIGFLMGLIGSLHCVGMCGPLVIALPTAHLNAFQKSRSLFLYHFGKISSYTLLGILFGLFGSQFPIHGLQENLSIVMGSIMLLYVLYVFIKKPIVANKIFVMNWIYSSMIKSLGQLFKSKNRFANYLIGLLNGLLPCGLVYMALTSAMATQNVMLGGIFMAFFGLGTTPALIMLSMGKQFMGVHGRQKLQRVLPLFIFSMGVLLILRGMNLGIPYLSPHLVMGADKITCPN